MRLRIQSKAPCNPPLTPPRPTGGGCFAGGWRLLQIHTRLSELLRSGRTLRGWTHDSPLSHSKRTATEAAQQQQQQGAVDAEAEAEVEAEQPVPVPAPVTTGYSALFGFNLAYDDAEDF
jgi:hypothetical protein